jgi:acetylornithine deacetylase/succinyl-diaminopimelate desuccinylase-like protein
MVAAMSLPPLTADAEEMCAHLLRIDTTNPPGNERPAVDYLAGKLREVGYDVTILESAPGRANLVTRYAARQRAARSPGRAPRCRRGRPDAVAPPAVLGRDRRGLPVGSRARST